MGFGATPETSDALWGDAADYLRRPAPEPPWAGRTGFVVIRGVRTGGRSFVLCQPVVATLGKCDELWTCEYEPLHLLGYGASIEEAIEAFFVDFAVASVDHETVKSVKNELRCTVGACIVIFVHFCGAVAILLIMFNISLFHASGIVYPPCAEVVAAMITVIRSSS